MSEMIGRIRKQLNPWIAKGEDGQKAQGLTEAQVRHILRTMRNPTGAMLRAASAAMSPGKRPRRWVSNRVKHRIRWQAMIDAALNEPPPKPWWRSFFERAKLSLHARQ